MLSSAVFVLAASMAVGQTNSSMPKDVRQQIDRHLIGEWTSQTTWGDQSASGEHRSAWTDGGQCVITEQVGSDFDGSTVHATTVLGWDAAKKCLVDFTITSKGEHWGYRWTDLKQDGWAGEGTGVYQNNEWSAPATLRFGEDGNRYEDVTEGKPFVIVWKRKATYVASEDVATADDYIAMQTNYFCGEWSIQGLEGDGVGSNGTWICRLDSTGRSFHEKGTMDGKDFLQAIGGYDPETQSLKEVVFYADGSTATLLYRHPRKLIQGSLIGKVLKGTMEHVSANGVKRAFDVLVEPQDRNTSVLTFHEQGNPSAIWVKAAFHRKEG
jgi:hypothetical protein